MTSQQVYHDLTLSRPLLQSASWIKAESFQHTIQNDSNDGFTEISKSTSPMLIEAIATLPCYMTEKKTRHVSYIHVPLDQNSKCQPTNWLISPEYIKYSKQHYPFRVNLCELSSGGISSKRWIEIWNNNKRIMTYDTTSLHGDYYLDDSLSGTCLSPDGVLFAYIADIEPNKQNTSSSDPLCGREEPDLDKLKKTYFHKQDFGEQYGKTKSRPSIILVNIQDMTVKKIQIEDRSLHPFKVQFYPSTLHKQNWQLLFIAYPTLPRQCGLRYCLNRPNGLYICDLEGKNLKHVLSNVSDGSITLKCFRDHIPINVDSTNQKGKEIVLLGSEAGGPHRSSEYLIHLVPDEKSSFSSKILVYGRSKNGQFPGPGLITNGLLPNPLVFAHKNKKLKRFLLFTAYWHFRTTIVSCDLDYPDDLINLTPEPEIASWTLLDHYENDTTCHLLAMVESFQFPPRLVFGSINLNDIQPPKWRNISLSNQLDTPSRSIEKDIFEWFLNQTKVETFFVPTESKDEPLHISLIHQTKPFGDKSNECKKLPCIVIPHGGPHVSFVHDWIPMIQGFVAMGYAILLINYTGSIGYGDESIKKLVGRIGTLDVEQTHNAVQYSIKKYDSIIDNQRVSVMGGSHGGFLAAWLSVRYGKLFYRAIIMRNPVVDLLLNYGGTDLPDWSFFEAGMDWKWDSPTFPPSMDQIHTMMKVSPSSRLSEASCDFLFVPPTMVMLGDQDRRVITANGHRWAEKLISKGILCELYVMPNTGHAIEGVANERDAFYLIIEFLKAHL